MIKEFKREGSYIELGFWNKWPEMLFGFELRPKWEALGFVFTFGLSVFYRELFYIQYTKFKQKDSK